MPVPPSPERRSLITVILALSLSFVLIGSVFIPGVLKLLEQQERERWVVAVLTAFRQDEPDLLRQALSHLSADAIPGNLLCEAASNGKTVILSQLLRSGWSVNGQEEDGLPLHLAVTVGQQETIAILIQGGAKLNLRYTADGATALFAAVRANNPIVAEMLLRAGSDPNIPLKTLPYRRRLYSGPLPGPKPRSIREYEERAEKLNDELREKTEGGTTPLICAAYNGSEAMVQLLLKYGADPNRKTISGRTALNLAHRFEQPKTIRILQNLPTLEPR